MLNLEKKAPGGYLQHVKLSGLSRSRRVLMGAVLILIVHTSAVYLSNTVRQGHLHEMSLQRLSIHFEERTTVQMLRSKFDEGQRTRKNLNDESLQQQKLTPAHPLPVSLKQLNNGFNRFFDSLVSFDSSAASSTASSVRPLSGAAKQGGHGQLAARSSQLQHTLADQHVSVQDIAAAEAGTASLLSASSQLLSKASPLSNADTSTWPKATSSTTGTAGRVSATSHPWPEAQTQPAAAASGSRSSEDVRQQQQTAGAQVLQATLQSQPQHSLAELRVSFKDEIPASVASMASANHEHPHLKLPSSAFPASITTDASPSGPSHTTWHPVPDSSPLPLPSSLAAWVCDEGSPEAQKRSGRKYMHELVMKSKEYVRSYGRKVPKARWCKGEVPWMVPQLRHVVLLQGAPPKAAQQGRGLYQQEGAASAGVTIVTELTLDRLHLLEAQCRQWPYAISAVLYVPLLMGRIFSGEGSAWHQASLDAGIKQVLRFHEIMKAETTCTLDLEVVSEERCTPDKAKLYPANSLRNRALLNVKTEAVLLLDVDLGVSRSLLSILSNAQQYKQLKAMLQDNNAVVLPAFELKHGGADEWQLWQHLLAGGKELVTRQYRDAEVSGSGMEDYPTAHRATDFERWFASSSAYEVAYEKGFEPFVLVATKQMPWYDERFRAQHWDRVQHLLHLSRQLKLSFVVHPSAYLARMPRAAINGKNINQAGQSEASYKMLKAALQEMDRGRFVPVTSFPQRCQGPLDGLKLP